MLLEFSNLKSCPSLIGGRELFLRKVRRGFLTYRIAINRTTRGKPLRLSLASSALLWKAKAFVVANIAYYAMAPLRAGAFLISFFADI